jgi:soluble lytic murein transglycosylase-like protein
MRAAAILVCAAPAMVLSAQEIDPAAQIRSRMEASLQQQRASTERQRRGIRVQMSWAAASSDSSDFFTLPWTQPAAFAPPPECDPVAPQEISPLVREISERQGLTPDLLRAVIEQESSYLPCAVSPKGAQGLMQLMPGTASLLGVEDPFEPRQNLDGGARFLRSLLDRYGGNLALALAAYNAGPARVDATGGVPPIPETMDYVTAILKKLTPEER